jgi:hypothetical protein
MENKLTHLKKVIGNFVYQRDIDSIVFDYNGHQQPIGKDCIGMRVIKQYNQEANLFNSGNVVPKLKKELINVMNPHDTKCFWILYCNPATKEQTTTYYFKQFIIVEKNNGSKYTAIRHFFSPDVLLFLKHFHQSQFVEVSMNFVRTNPHYFKHHTVDSLEQLKNMDQMLQSLIEDYRQLIDDSSKMTSQMDELILENQKLHTIIHEMNSK